MDFSSKNVTISAIALSKEVALSFVADQEPKATYLFMGNLAMADLVYSLVAIFGPMYPVEYRNHYICAVIMGDNTEDMFLFRKF